MLLSGTSPDFRHYAPSYNPYRGDEDYAVALISLASRLKGSLLNKGLDAGRMISTPLLRLKVLIAFMPHVSTDSREAASRDALRSAAIVLRDALELGRPDERMSTRARTLVELICVLPGRFRNEGMELLVTLMSNWHRWDGKDLVDVFRNLPAENDRQIIGELLKAISKIESSSMRANALISLLPSLEGEAQSGVAARALDSARRIASDPMQIRTITSIIPYLAMICRELAMRSVLQKSLGIFHEGQRVAAVASITRFMEGPERQSLLEEMLIIGTTIPSAAVRCRALVSLIPEFSDDRKRRIFEDALLAARSVKRADERSRSLLSLAAVADPGELNIILDEASSISGDELRSEIFARLSPELPAESISKLWLLP